MTFRRRLFAAAVFTLPFATMAVGCGSITPPAGVAGDSCETSQTAIAGSPGPDGLAGMCLDLTPSFGPMGASACVVLELRSAGDTCDCDPAAGFAPVTAEHLPAVPAGTACACEVQQIAGIPDGTTCQYDGTVSPLGSDQKPLNGWCYLDATIAPPVGNPALIARCPEGERRFVRFVGAPATVPPMERKLLALCTGPADTGCSP